MFPACSLESKIGLNSPQLHGAKLSPKNCETSLPERCFTHLTRTYEEVSEPLRSLMLYPTELRAHFAEVLSAESWVASCKEKMRS